VKKTGGQIEAIARKSEKAAELGPLRRLGKLQNQTIFENS
jgi:hypothetical protein